MQFGLGLGLTFQRGGPAGEGPVVEEPGGGETNNLLAESSDAILLESGDKLLLEA